MIYKYSKKDSTFKNIFLKTITTTFLTLVLSLWGTGLFFYYLGQKDGIGSLSNEERTVVIKQIDPFKVQELKDYLVELKVKFPDIVYAQARLESNGFSSRIFKENNNMFGMKQSTRRSSTNKGEQFGHAYYDTWRESVLDYALWQCKYLSSIHTRAEYLQYLKQNYAEDPNYYNKLIKIINNG
jgi:uncharacterized FlgJ-related protein